MNAKHAKLIKECQGLFEASRKAYAAQRIADLLEEIAAAKGQS